MPEYNKLNSLFCEFINSKFIDFAKASGKDKEIKIEIKAPIFYDKDIEQLIDLINTMYQSYLVATNCGKKR